MLTSLLESVLPGVRDVRSPLVAGALWLLLGWLVLAESIPPRDEAAGFVRQVFDLSRSAGPTTTLVVVSIVAYLIGVVNSTIADGIHRAIVKVRAVSMPIIEPVRWQLHARRSRRQLRKRLGLSSDARDVDQYKTQMDALSPSMVGLWIRKSTAATRAAGPEPWTNTPYEMAQRAVENAIEHGVHEAQLARQIDLVHGQIQIAHEEYIDQLLTQDLGDEPSEALRAADAGLYQAFDRERAEREFRVRTMLPLTILAGYVGVEIHVIGVAVAILSVATFMVASCGETDARIRVLRVLTVKGAPLPALRAAETRGRSAVRSHLAKELEKEQKRKQQDARQSDGRIAPTPSS